MFEILNTFWRETELTVSQSTSCRELSHHSIRLVFVAVEVVEDVVDEEEGADEGGGGTGTGTGGTSKCVGVFINNDEPSNCAHAFYSLQVNNNYLQINFFEN